MCRAHELKDLAHKESSGGQSASAKPQAAAAQGSGGAQPASKAKTKPETDEFEDPDKNIHVCCTGCSMCIAKIQHL